jgi:transcriptional regulator with GAF, ATPase, and Fis domain
LSEAKIRLNIDNQLRINDEAISALARYASPGNVRQLCHVVERVALSAGEKGTISANDVSQVLNEIRRLRRLQRFHLAFVKTIHSMNFWRELPLVCITISAPLREITLRRHVLSAFIETRFTNVLSERGEYCDPIDERRGLLTATKAGGLLNAIGARGRVVVKKR